MKIYEVKSAKGPQNKLDRDQKTYHNKHLNVSSFGSNLICKFQYD